MRLEITADKVKYVRHVANGELTEVRLVANDEAYKSSKDYSSTDELATHYSSVSQISATATNTDRLTASFTLRVERCSR